MTTFGVFFKRLRQRIEQTGRTDTQCGDMDNYHVSHQTESAALSCGEEDSGWRAVADQELSHSNLLEFSREMTRAGVEHLTREAESDLFDPDRFSWTLNSVHEFHHAMLQKARECGLDVDRISSWSKAKKR